MVDPKIVELLELVSERTVSGLLQWTQDSERDAFISTMTSGVILRVFSFSFEEGGEKYGPPSIVIYDASDNIIVDITANLGISQDTLATLYEQVRRASLGIDEALDKAISELKQLGATTASPRH